MELKAKHVDVLMKSPQAGILPDLRSVVIIGERVDPETDRGTNEAVSVALLTTDAMTLLAYLLKVQQKHGLEIPEMIPVPGPDRTDN